MALWNDLPTELVILILEHLTLTRDIVNALPVCHLFRTLLEPNLYKAVDISKSDDDEVSPSVMLLLRTVVARPDLGLLVRSLSFGSLGESEGEYEEGISEVHACSLKRDDGSTESLWRSLGGEPDDLGPLLSALAQKGLPNGVILSGSRGQIVFLLHYTPNLASLTFECCSGVATIALAVLGRFVGGVPAGLQSITRIVLNYDDTEMGFSTEDVVPFFSLPALSEIYVWSFAGDEWGNTFPDSSVEDQGDTEDQLSRPAVHPRSSSSSVTHLEFKHSAIDCDALNRILTLPRRLESFKYSLGDARVGYWPFIPSWFYPGLCGHAESLVELFITDEDDVWNFDDEEWDPILGSLHAFKALAHLRLPAELLLGVNNRSSATEFERVATRSFSPLDALLPPSLVILELELRGEDPLKHFMATTGIPKTLTQTSHQLPDLRIFHLGVEGHFGIDLSENGKEIAMLNSQCEAVPPTVHQIILKAGSPYFYL